MSQQNLIDLNDLIAEDKRVTLGGDVWTLPGDMPMLTFLQLQRVGQLEQSGDAEKTLEAMESLLSSLAELFTYRLDGLAPDALVAKREQAKDEIGRLGIKGVSSLLGRIYGEDDGAEATEADADRPTSGTTSTTKEVAAAT